MQTPLILLVLSTITPLTIIFLSSVNYYWDYFQNIYAKDASADVYDFIVGKSLFSLSPVFVKCAHVLQLFQLDLEAVVQ